MPQHNDGPSIICKMAKSQWRPHTTVPTYFVAPRGRKGFFGSLNDAIAFAEPYSRIEVTSGRYFENVVIGKPIEIGTEKGDEAAEFYSHGKTFVLQAEEAYVDGITIKTGDQNTVALSVESGSPKIVRCDIDSLEVIGRATPHIEDNRVRRGKRHGIHLSGSAGGVYKGNTIEHHQWYCIKVESDGSPHFSYNTVSLGVLGQVQIHFGRTSKTDGVVMFESNKIIDEPPKNDTKLPRPGKGKELEMRATNDAVYLLPHSSGARGRVHVDSEPDVKADTLQWENHAAIEVGFGATPRFLRNYIVSGVNNGVYFYSGGGGHFEGNHITGNQGFGVVIDDDGDPVLLENKIGENGSGGIRVRNNAKGLVKRNDFRENRGPQIMVQKGCADFKCVQNVFRAGTKVGVWCREGGCGYFEENEFTDCGYVAFRVDTEGNPLVRNNTFLVNHTGVLVCKMGAGVFENNTFANHKRACVEVSSGGHPTFTACRITNSATGILVTNKGYGRFEKNHIKENRGPQIDVQGRSNPTFVNNFIMDGREEGLKVTTHARGLYTNNSFVKNLLHIYVSTGADPTVTDNLLSQTVTEGIVIEDGGLGLVTGNLIQKSRLDGVLVSGGSTFPTIRGNIITENEGSGLRIAEGADGIFEKNSIRANRHSNVLISGNGIGTNIFESQQSAVPPQSSVDQFLASTARHTRAISPIGGSRVSPRKPVALALGKDQQVFRNLGVSSGTNSPRGATPDNQPSIALPVVKRNWIEHASGAGVVAQNHGNASIIENYFGGNAGAAVKCGTSSILFVAGNLVDGGGGGIEVSDEAYAFIVLNKFVNVEGKAVLFESGAKPFMAWNTLINCQVGIACVGGSGYCFENTVCGSSLSGMTSSHFNRTMIARNIVSECRNGIHIGSKSRAQVFGNYFLDAKENGVLVDGDEITGTVEGNVVLNSLGVGLAVLNGGARVSHNLLLNSCINMKTANHGATPIVTFNYIAMGRVGVQCEKGCRGRMEGNLIGHNDRGFVLKTHASATVKNCCVYNSSDAGVFAEDHGGGEFVECSLFKNNNNVFSRRGGAPYFFQCVIQAAFDTNTYFYDGGCGHAYRCVIRANTEAYDRPEGAPKSVSPLQRKASLRTASPSAADLSVVERRGVVATAEPLPSLWDNQYPDVQLERDRKAQEKTDQEVRTRRNSVKVNAPHTRKIASLSPVAAATESESNDGLSQPSRAVTPALLDDPIELAVRRSSLLYHTTHHNNRQFFCSGIRIEGTGSNPKIEASVVTGHHINPSMGIKLQTVFTEARPANALPRNVSTLRLASMRRASSANRNCCTSGPFSSAAPSTTNTAPPAAPISAGQQNAAARRRSSGPAGNSNISLPKVLSATSLKSETPEEDEDFYDIPTEVNLVHVTDPEFCGFGLIVCRGGKGHIFQSEFTNNTHGLRLEDGGDARIEGSSICFQTGHGIVVAQGGRGHIIKNSIRKNKLFQILISGSGTCPSIEENDITDSEMTGIQVDSSAEGVIARNRISRFGTNGITVMEKGNPEVAENEVWDCLHNVCIRQNGRGTFTANRLYEARAEGVLVDGEHANATFIKNLISFCAGSGAFLTGDSNPVFEGNEFFLNKGNGLEQGQKCNALVKENKFYDNEGHGCVASHGSKGRFEANVMTGNKGAGFSAQTSATPTVVSNVLYDGENDGIAIAGANGVYECNRLRANLGNGISVAYFTSCPSIRFNDIDGSERAGIQFTSEAKGTVEQNLISGNERGGIYVESSASPSISKNWIKENNYAGIWCASGACPTLTNNIIVRTTAGSGILVTSDATPSILRNIIGYNSFSGIHFREAGKGTASENILFSNTDANVCIESKSTPSNTGNFIFDGKYGILVRSGGAGFLTSNNICGNVANGILVEEGGTPTLEGCFVHDIKQTGIVDAGGGAYTNCAVFGCGTGVEFTGDGTSEFVDGEIRECGVGVMFSAGNGRIVKSTISNNLRFGIQSAKASLGIVSKCKIFRGKAGMQLEGGGEVNECELYWNTDNVVVTGGDALIANNTIYDATNCGIWVKDGRPEIRANFIFDNNFTSLLVDAGSPIIDDNRIFFPRDDGAYVAKPEATPQLNKNILRNVTSPPWERNTTDRQLFYNAGTKENDRLSAAFKRHLRNGEVVVQKVLEECSLALPEIEAITPPVVGGALSMAPSTVRRDTAVVPPSESPSPRSGSLLVDQHSTSLVPPLLPLFPSPTPPPVDGGASQQQPLRPRGASIFAVAPLVTAARRQSAQAGVQLSASEALANLPSALFGERQTSVTTIEDFVAFGASSDVLTPSANSAALQKFFKQATARIQKRMRKIPFIFRDTVDAAGALPSPADPLLPEKKSGVGFAVSFSPSAPTPTTPLIGGASRGRKSVATSKFLGAPEGFGSSDFASAASSSMIPVPSMSIAYPGLAPPHPVLRDLARRLEDLHAQTVNPSVVVKAALAAVDGSATPIMSPLDSASAGGGQKRSTLLPTKPGDAGGIRSPSVARGRQKSLAGGAKETVVVVPAPRGSASSAVADNNGSSLVTGGGSFRKSNGGGAARRGTLKNK